MKRKSLLILMALILCLSSFTGITTSAFSDLKEGDRHNTAITFLTENGVIHGYEDGTFKPDNDITRSEFLTLLLEFTGTTNIYGETEVITGFADVDKGTHKVNDAGKEYTITNDAQHWAAGYIKLAVDKKIVSGYGNGLFKPDAPVTYEEAIKMVVCALGREGMAQTKVDKMGIPFWPDAYLSVGNDLLISKNTDYAPNTEATRSNIAQMLYNVKDVNPIVAPNVNPGTTGGYGGGGGGGYGGGGGGSYADGTTDEDGGTPTTPISNLSAKGQVVAAVRKSGGTKKRFVIDENIIINEQPVTDVGTNFIILKLDVPIDGNDYEQFYTGSDDFSSYLGYKVEIKYTFNPNASGPNGANRGRNDIENIYTKDTEVITILSSDFKMGDTIEKNNDPNTQETHICYTDGEEDYAQSLYTNDLNTLTVVYNNKIVDVESHSITLEDLMPKNGNITLVDAYEDRSFDLIWVNSYETYVVSSKNTTTKTITDKFRKDEHDEAVTLTLDSENVEIFYKGEEKEFSDIPSNSVLTVAASKCGTSIEVKYEKVTSVKSGNIDVRTVNGVKDSFVIGSKTYPLSDYFLQYVDEELEFTSDDTLTLYYYSGSNEVFWATVSEPAYSTGYLMRVRSNDLDGKISLDILTLSGNVTTFTMAESRTKYITKAHTCLDDASIVADSMTNANGYLYKDLPENMIYASLQENAALINAGKPSSITLNASVAQPVMYIATSGNVLTSLVTAELDAESAYTGTNAKKYTKSTSGTYVFAGEDTTFSATSTSTFIFVPNDRLAYPTGNGYKIGTATSTAISKKLIEYMNYNVEPYYVADATGARSRKIFVVYNQTLDATPNYRSENIVVTSIENTESGSKITGYVDSVTSTKPPYTCYSENIIKNAVLLDENFVRTNLPAHVESGEPCVEVGDVIRVGYSPIGAVANIEIILDASNATNAAKSFAVSRDGEIMSTNNPSKLYVYYYARVGRVTRIDQSETPEYCDFEINGGVSNRLWIGSGYNNTSILLYDMTDTTLNNGPKPAKMEDLQEGDVLFVKQGEDLVTKQIYAVRPTVVTP